MGVMRDTDKEDVFIALRSFERYIQEMSDDDFQLFIIGKPVFGAMMPPKFHLDAGSPTDFTRGITRLEFRIS